MTESAANPDDEGIAGAYSPPEPPKPAVAREISPVRFFDKGTGRDEFDFRPTILPADTPEESADPKDSSAQESVTSSAEADDSEQMEDPGQTENPEKSATEKPAAKDSGKLKASGSGTQTS